jgi:hypothetical protein
MSTLVVLVVLFQRLQDPNPHVLLRSARVGTIGKFVGATGTRPYPLPLSLFVGSAWSLVSVAS